MMVPHSLIERFARFACDYLTPIPRNTQRAIELLKPTIENLLMRHEENGDSWPEKPVCGFLEV